MFIPRCGLVVSTVVLLETNGSKRIENEGTSRWTGLTGKFVWEARAGSLKPGATGAGDIDPNLPPLNLALQEQLGLKLEEQRMSMDASQSVGPRKIH